MIAQQDDERDDERNNASGQPVSDQSGVIFVTLEKQVNETLDKLAAVVARVALRKAGRRR